MSFMNPITGNKIVPRFTIPTAFGQCLSYADQILWLAHALDGIYDEIGGSYDGLQEQIDANAAAIQQVRADLALAVKKLEDEISHISEGAMLWQVYAGKFGTNVETMRGTANFLADRALTVEELPDEVATVQALAGCGLNCHGLAVYSRWLIDESQDLPPRFAA